MEFVEQFAETVGANGRSVRSAAANGRYLDIVNRDRDLGDELGISETLALIDGQLLAPSETEIDRVVVTAASA